MQFCNLEELFALLKIINQMKIEKYLSLDFFSGCYELYVLFLEQIFYDGEFLQIEIMRKSRLAMNVTSCVVIFFVINLN